MPDKSKRAVMVGWLLLVLALVQCAGAAGLGGEVWVQRFNGPGAGADQAVAMVVDGKGNVYVTGSSIGLGTEYDYTTVSYAPDGTERWVRRYDGPLRSDDYAQAIAVDDAGNVYVTGRSIGRAGLDYSTRWDYATVSYTSEGVQRWVQRYDGPGNNADYASDVSVDGNGQVYVTGYSFDDVTGWDYLTVSYSSGGAELWVRRYDGTGSSTEHAWALAVDGNGNVYVTGSSKGTSASWDYTTVSYASDGTERWVRHYNGPNNDTDVAEDVDVDGNGNVYVTGYSFRDGGSSEFATICYASDGTPRWTRRYRGSGNRNDQAQAVAVVADGAGNVYVAGFSLGSNARQDFTTVSYTSGGVERWVRHYDGPGNNDDVVQAMSVDESGNVYVSGYSGGVSSFSDYATVSYSPAGGERWVRRYNGPGNGWAAARAMVVDKSGNVYVTGYSMEPGTGLDYVTINYGSIPSNADPIVQEDKSLVVREDDPNTPLGITAPTDPNGEALRITVDEVPNSALAAVRRANGGNAVAVGNVLTISELTGLELALVPNAHGLPGALQYSVTNDRGGYARQVITFSITPVNDAPVARGESYTTPLNTPVAVPAPGLLANDTDVDGDPLTAQLVTPPANGELTLELDGSFRYAPYPGFSGTDQFTYRVSDGIAASEAATVTITVDSEPPTLTAQSRVHGSGKLGKGPKAPSLKVNTRVKANGKIQGKVIYKAPGTALKSTRVTYVAADGSHARIFGEGKLKGVGLVSFVLDVHDLNPTRADRKQGIMDRVQLHTSGDLSVPETTLVKGNLHVR